MMKTKKQKRFLKKFDLTKIVDRPEKGKEYIIPIFIQKGGL